MNLRDAHIEFLLEEPSMEHFLKELLPKVLPDGYVLNRNCFLRPHEGKNDLKKSIPKKVKVFSRKPNAKIIIVHDQDSNNCINLKNQIIDICRNNGECPVLVRIVCKELENWYLGDLNAIKGVYPNFKPEKYSSKSKFRDVDNVFGCFEMENMVKEFSKTHTAKSIVPFMDIENNKSTSFKNFVSGLQKFLP